MSSEPVTHLARLLAPMAGLSDDALLNRFTSESDSDAFAELVRRHGPMVLGVCGRVLFDPADIEDAVQATFVVLARKARKLTGQALGGWLYGVARRSALKARAAAIRRRQ